MSAYLQLRVIAIEEQPTEVLKISFEQVTGPPLSYRAGQFLTLVFEVNGRELKRSYSLCSSPDVDEPIAIAVKLVENGEISRLIHHQLAVGDEVMVDHPNGKFIFEPQTEIQRTIFLFAAGVGITPLLSILKTALIKEPQSKVVLIYSSRSSQETLFLQDLDGLKKAYPRQLEVIHLFSNSKNLMRARLNGFLVGQLVKTYLHFDRRDALFYTCGPIDYMDVCRITLLGLGFHAVQVRRETFVIPEDETDEDDSTEKIVDKNTYSVNLHFRGDVYHLDVPFPKRILEVALAHQIDLPYSCSGGVCSTCTATCVRGGVRMDYNEVLTDEEIASGRVLVCTGHPTENDTTIIW